MTYHDIYGYDFQTRVVLSWDNTEFQLGLPRFYLRQPGQPWRALTGYSTEVRRVPSATPRPT